MKYWRQLRDCPKCGANKGFACHKWEDMPNCPQHYLADPEPNMSDVPSTTGIFVWPFVPKDD